MPNLMENSYQYGFNYKPSRKYNEIGRLELLIEEPYETPYVEPTAIYLDERTGIVVADRAAFEQWMDDLGRASEPVRGGW